MGEQRLLSPEERDALCGRLDALIEEARILRRPITERLLVTRRGDQQDRTDQPERREHPRKK